jgi:predicted transcriptional regulator
MGGRIIEHLEYSEQCLQKMKDYGIDINSLAEKATCATIAVSKIPKKKRTVHLWFQDGGSLYHFVLNQRKGLQRGLHNVIYVANELIKKEKAVNIGWKS